MKLSRRSFLGLLPALPLVAKAIVKNPQPQLAWADSNTAITKQYALWTPEQNLEAYVLTKMAQSGCFTIANTPTMEIDGRLYVSKVRKLKICLKGDGNILWALRDPLADEVIKAARAREHSVAVENEDGSDAGVKRYTTGFTHIYAVRIPVDPYYCSGRSVIISGFCRGRVFVTIDSREKPYVFRSGVQDHHNYELNNLYLPPSDNS